MRSRLWLSLVLASLSACSVISASPRSVGYAVPREPPPAKLERERPPASAPGQIWVAGYWENVDRGYVWRPGHWVSARPGFVYVPAGYRHQGSSWYFDAPHWRRQRASAPPTATTAMTATTTTTTTAAAR